MMHPDYRKKIYEAQALEKDRLNREARDRKPVKVPNLERMPLGCWMWVLAIVAAVYYFLRKF